jgi:diacylglycerol kinase
MQSHRSKSLVQALAYAAEGLRYAVQTQRTFRIQLVLAVAVGVVLLWVQATALEAAVVALAMIVVLAAELLNTGVEVVVDLLVDRNHHVLAKVAKDIAAAGVVVTVVGAAVVGFLVLGPRVGAAIGIDVLMAARWSRVLALLAILAGAGILAQPSRGSPHARPAPPTLPHR